MTNKIALETIERNRDTFIKISREIWEHPETAFNEKFASKILSDYLKEQGFEVELGYLGIPTAIRAVWGNGKPIIGMLAEYDALPGLSQKMCAEKDPVEPGAPGHGCGHHAIAVCKLAAAVALKTEMEERKLPGTVVFYGCPAEETVAGKVMMAREGAFRELDLAFAWHPMQTNEVYNCRWSGLNSAKFHFSGISAHAGFDPYNGRSALDAVELMNVGANYLREHVTDDVRIHYAITNGGVVPNIVPDKASVWYYVRALSREAVTDTYDRLIKVAKGAAMMTDTNVEIEFIGGCYNTVPNKELVRLVHETMQEIPSPEWTAEEVEFCKKLNDTCAPYKQMLASGAVAEGTHIADSIPEPTTQNSFASTDVGDVMHIVPTAFFATACTNLGASAHSWQFAAATGSDVGMKGMLYAAKIIAVSAVKAIEDSSIVERAKADFDKMMNGKSYVCPMPADMTLPN